MYNICGILLKGITNMKAVITVTGKDTVGIIAKVSAECAKHGANIVDISQRNTHFTDFVDKMNALGKESGLMIQTMHEEIFQAMHTI